MQDGWLSTEMTASQERLGEYTDRLSTFEIPFTIQSLSRLPDSGELLTDRQWEFLTEAIERGYYDSPRQCTPTELANTFEVNSSAASGVLHRAEERIIKFFVKYTGNGLA